MNASRHSSAYFHMHAFLHVCIYVCCCTSVINYTSLGLSGCSSHSGRRTFITHAARKVSEMGGSLRDVQQLAGHTSLAMMQSYIEGATEAKRKLIALI